MTVVVPVYGAAEAFARCLAALDRHLDRERHLLLLVADGPQPEAVDALLAGAAAAPGNLVLRLERRGGFVAAVNRGIDASPGRDVLLLNSDTQVTHGWLDKLTAAATSSPEVATATPFSNSATICSLPRWLESNALPAGYSLDAFATLVESASVREYPRLPTGVGFCLYVRRHALERVGRFDEAGFGLGYGEEVDWCLRARAAGLAHVLDDATFVYHEGQSSFGPSRDARVRAARREIRRRHPGYEPEIAALIRADPLRPARDRVRAALAARRPTAARSAASRPLRVLHVVHGWPGWSSGGTEVYAAGLARRQARTHAITVLARFANRSWSLGDALELDDRGARVRLLVNNFDQRDPRSRNGLTERRFERDFSRLLREAAPDLVHVHHLAGLCATLPGIAVRRGIAVVVQLQDWWTGCSRANLLDVRGRLCSGPGVTKCGQCLPLTGLPGAAIWNPLLYAWRYRLLRGVVRKASARIAGSQAIVASFRDLGWLAADEAVAVLPYGVEPPASAIASPSAAERRAAAGSLRFGFVGALMPHKGPDLAVAAFAGLPPERVRLLLWGSERGAPEFSRRLRAAAGPAVEFRGPFPDGDLERVLASFDVLVVPSRGLESFGLVAREAMLRGLPVLAARRGALPEIFAGHQEFGALFDADDPAELRSWIERLAVDPAILERWRRAVPPVKTMDEHVLEIEDVYRRVLARRAAK